MWQIRDRESLDSFWFSFLSVFILSLFSFLFLFW
jgi:hypothetical protein